MRRWHARRRPGLRTILQRYGPWHELRRAESNDPAINATRYRAAPHQRQPYALIRASAVHRHRVGLASTNAASSLRPTDLFAHANVKCAKRSAGLARARRTLLHLARGRSHDPITFPRRTCLALRYRRAPARGSVDDGARRPADARSAPFVRIGQRELRAFGQRRVAAGPDQPPAVGRRPRVVGRRTRRVATGRSVVATGAPDAAADPELR